jgi:hypothetical protein
MRVPLILVLALAGPAQAATLNKCVNEETGLVTYTNLKCPKTQHTHTLELDPPPVPERKRRAVPAVPMPPAVPSPATVTETPPTQVAPAIAEPGSPPSPASPQAAPPAAAPIRPRAGSPAKAAADARVCNTLAQQLGHLLDRLDARRDAADAAQMRAWQEEINALEARKRATGCF